MDRTQFIGASEIGALFGCHPFKKPIDIFNDKMGVGNDFKKSKAKELGNFLETGLASYFAKMFLNGAKLGGYQKHYRKGVLGSTLDFIIEEGSYKRRKFDRTVLDCKTFGLSGTLPYHTEYGKAGTDQVPLHVFYQMQQQAFLFNEEHRDPIDDVFVGTLDFQGKGTRLYRIPYRREIGLMMEEVANRFWEQHILPCVPPPENKLSFVELTF